MHASSSGPCPTASFDVIGAEHWNSDTTALVRFFQLLLTLRSTGTNIILLSDNRKEKHLWLRYVTND